MREGLPVPVYVPMSLCLSRVLFFLYSFVSIFASRFSVTFCLSNLCLYHISTLPRSPPPSILLFILYSCRIPWNSTLNFPFSNREGKPRNFTAAFTIEICSSERSDRGTQNLTLPHYILLRVFPRCRNVIGVTRTRNRDNLRRMKYERRHGTQ